MRKRGRTGWHQEAGRDGKRDRARMAGGSGAGWQEDEWRDGRRDVVGSRKKRSEVEGRKPRAERGFNND